MLRIVVCFCVFVGLGFSFPLGDVERDGLGFDFSPRDLKKNGLGFGFPKRELEKNGLGFDFPKGDLKKADMGFRFPKGDLENNGLDFIFPSRDLKKDGFGFDFPSRDLPKYNANNFAKRQPKQIIGQWIMNTEWLPIEVNVPDTINSISNGFQNFAQQIPFINQIFSQERPRPLSQYVVFVPVGSIKLKQRIPDNSQRNNEFYGPFDNFANKFPAYP